MEIINVIVNVRATLSLKLNKTVPSDHSVLFSLYFWEMTVPSDRTIFAIFNFELFLEIPCWNISPKIIANVRSVTKQKKPALRCHSSFCFKVFFIEDCLIVFGSV